MFVIQPGESGAPFDDQPQDGLNIKAFKRGGILLEIALGQFEKGFRGFEPVLLQMHKRACELNEPLEKQIARSLPLGQPKLFENVVGLIIELLVEALEVTQVMGIEFVSLASCN